MEHKDKPVANGFNFISAEDAGLAETEGKKADYFRKKVNKKDIKGLLAVYNKILDEKVFQTPVGWEYLRELQENLRTAGAGEESIRPIPLFVSFAHKNSGETDNHIVKQRIRPAAQKRQRIKPLWVSVLLNVLLVILVLSMFAITLQSDNPNILNYQKALTTQYAQWEQELSEREQALREREQAVMEKEQTAVIATEEDFGPDNQ